MTSSNSLENEPIGIVTAFFDIGRTDWTADKGLPGYLFRPTAAYFQRFAHLAALENPMAVYTSPDLAPLVRALRQGKEDRTQVVEVPYAAMFGHMRAAIARVQQDPGFAGSIDPKQKGNPEYWSADYVLVNTLKSVFVTDAIENKLITGSRVAWVDFGICRTREGRGDSPVWRYPFSPDKIHLLSFGPYLGKPPIPEVVRNNVICVVGGIIVAGAGLWAELRGLVNRAFEELLAHNLIDDDQTMLLLATLYRPDLFEMHTIVEADWQSLMRKFSLP